MLITRGTEQAVLSADGTERYIFDLQGRHKRTENVLTGATKLTITWSGEQLAAITDAYSNTTKFTYPSADTCTIRAPFGPPTTLAKDPAIDATRDPAGAKVAAIFTDPVGRQSRVTYADGDLMLSLRDPAGSSGHGGDHVFSYDGVGRLTNDTSPTGSSKSLVRTDLAGGTPGWEVDVSTAMGKVTKHQITYSTQSDGSQAVQQGLTNEAGLTTTKLWSSQDTVMVTSLPGGLDEETDLAPDPRFGGGVLFAAHARTSSVGGAKALLRDVVRTTTDKISYTDAATYSHRAPKGFLSGGTWTTAWAGSAAGIQRTVTTPSGRQVVATLDSTGERVLALASAGVAPIQFYYDGNGRLALLQQGPSCSPPTANPSFSCSASSIGAAPSSCRQTAFGYDAANGWPACSFDALGYRWDAQHDDAGRLVGLAAPGDGATKLRHEAWGDVALSVPTWAAPSGATHQFTTTFTTGFPTNYIPPPLAKDGTTSVDYNLDGDVSGVVRASSTGSIQLLYDPSASGGRLHELIDQEVPHNARYGSLSFGYDPIAGYLASENHLSPSAQLLDARSTAIDLSDLSTSVVLTNLAPKTAVSQQSASVVAVVDGFLRPWSLTVSAGAPDFAPSAQSIWRPEPQRPPHGVGWQGEAPVVHDVQQSAEGLALIARTGGLQGDDDGPGGDGHGAGRGEEVGECALGLDGLAQMFAEQSGELALDVRAGDADRVERGLVLVLVPNEDIGELGLAERCVGRCLGTLCFEGLLLGENLVEVALPACAPVVVGLELRELTPCTALAGARDA